MTALSLPKDRVILLGASNITRSFSTLVATVRHFCGGPVEILAAHGRGRSYGISTSFVGRRLPGLRDCNLWSALPCGQTVPTFALVTDIGNDLLYEFDVPIISDWVELCLARLAAMNVKTIVTALPIGNIPNLSEARYKFFRTILFPGCRLSLKEINERTIELNDRVRVMATARAMVFVSPERSWYGADPVHVRRSSYREAWRMVLSHWRDDHKISDISRAKWHESLYLRSRRPHEMTFLGRAVGASQPSARLRDGTTIALY